MKNTKNEERKKEMQKNKNTERYKTCKENVKKLEHK